MVGDSSGDSQVFVKAFSSLKRITCFGISEYCSRIAMAKNADLWLGTCFCAWQGGPVSRLRHLPAGPKASAMQQKLCVEQESS